MDYEARRKEQECISRVNARTYTKLEAKARRVVTTVRKRNSCGGKVAEQK